MNTTNGKMVIESRKKLKDALLIIMRQYHFKEITVTQITQEAKLSRKTFYRLYSNKEEILEEYFQSLFEAFKVKGSRYSSLLGSCTALF